MKKCKELFINNFNLSVSVSLLAISGIIFFISSFQVVSIIIFAFLLLVIFSFVKKPNSVKDKNKAEKENIDTNKIDDDTINEFFYDDIMKKAIYNIKDYDFVLIIQDTVNNIKEVLNCISGNKSYIRMHNSITDYYIPTISKFIYTYVDLDNCSMEERNKDRVRLEIKRSICAINYGFDRMKRNIDTNILIDINSDISVLKAMLLKDGLVKEKDFLK
ncbi:hypothetical protein R4K55_13490 [Brachyspira alvinipulli]|uniref:hypothetical protein n=1 Tax=Brachyspira alvinipulli TaxID=84379 RepID=UPI00300795BF